MKPTPLNKFRIMALASVLPCVAQAAQIDVIAEQTISHPTLGANVDAITTDTTWTKDNIYILKDKVFVTDGATLTIEAGTKIYSTLDDKGTGTKDDDEFGALVITRGSNIEAQGTAAEPIIFTTTDELEFETQTDIDGDTFIADCPTETTYARWGGVVMLGSAPITIGGIAGTVEDRIEGFQPAASTDLDLDGRADVIEYGGNVAADSSGTISYVVIRHGGYVYSGSNEINGLTLGGVGSGTQIDHVEVFANADDGIEFFGGTVNTSHIALVFNQDDSFDIDQGHKGAHQFWFCVQTPFAQDGVTSGHDNGGEWDGTTGTILDDPDNSAPVIYNATFIGSGTTSALGNDKGNNAIFAEDFFRGKVYNSVFDDFREHLIEIPSGEKGATMEFAHNTVGRFGAGTPGNNLSYLNGASAADTFFDVAGTPINGNSNGGIDPQYTQYQRDFSTNSLIALDPRPSAGSPLLASNGATLQGGAPVATDYRGAFGSENWAAGWTTTDARGLFTPKVEVIAEQTISHPTLGANVDAISTDTTWTKDNIYILRDKVFLTDGATLTIEAGTKIYSTLDDKGTGTKDDDEFGALVITRGSNIEAQGTAAEPIIFTTTDELEAQTCSDIDGDGFIAEAPGVTTYARWGGVVVLGSAPITIGGVAGTVEDRIEGFQPAASTDLDLDGRADVIEYGGNVTTDDSGTISYVVIRHGGYVYSGSNEINGLTLGGVGSGTQIDHVEVFANADDGIEFFGGTVNTSHIALVFNQDDSFDIDQGHKGTHQFWFCVQTPFGQDGVSSGHDNGGEWDGTTGTIVDDPDNSAPVIYNATFIGSGTTAALGNDKGNNAIFAEDFFRGKVYNSVFDSFREHLIEIPSGEKGATMEFAHNTVGRFGAGTPGNNLSYLNGASAADTFFNIAGTPINGNSDGGVNPRYISYVRDSDNTLIRIDPRPASNSPLLASNGATLQGGAPATTDYRGAFGSENWAAGWTTASGLGILLGEAPASGGSFADIDGDGVSDALESANTDLGFNPAVNDAFTVLANVYTTAQVQADPAAFGLYDETSILDLRTVGQTMVQKVGGNVTLTVPVEKSNSLIPGSWVPAGNMTLGPFVGDPNKEFYRLKVEGAE